MGGTEYPILKELCGAVTRQGQHGYVGGFSWGRSAPWLRSQQRAEQTWRTGAVKLVRDSVLGAAKTVSKTRSAEP